MAQNTPPGQEQAHQPGRTDPMEPRPRDLMETYRASGKLAGKRAIVTGGDSGIGRAVAIAFAKEGADVAVLYKEENKDATVTAERVRTEGRTCLTFPGDIGDRSYCFDAVNKVLDAFGGLDILVNNAAEQHMSTRFEEIPPEQFERTFRTNLFGMFHMTQAALPHMGEGATIINTTSVTAYHGNPSLVDYSATKGAIVAFTRSLSIQLADRGIRVNAVAPGPVWTPLIPSSFPEEKVEGFGGHTPMSRVGQPDEIAPSYVFLAGPDSTYFSGQVLHPNGGQVVNG